MASKPITPDACDFSLCLSGGGLRATLFHLGLIRALRDARCGEKRAIDGIREIYSVSGGSILGAHMMANWAAYAGTSDQFQVIEQAMLAFVDSNLRDRVVRRAVTQRLWDHMRHPGSLLPGAKHRKARASRRAQWLKHLYADLVGQSAASDHAATPDLPLFFILSTSFRSAELCAFTNEGFELEARDSSLRSGPAQPISLAEAIAASSAFPPLFPPIHFPGSILYSPDVLDAQGNPKADGSILLSDGGVYDNLGVEKYLCRLNRGEAATRPRLLISNCGAAFRNDDINAFANALGRNLRASDVLMDRVSVATQKAVHRMTEVTDWVVSINPSIPKDGTKISDEDLLYAKVRTDLDAFPADLAKSLIACGERKAREALDAAGWKFGQPLPPASAITAGQRTMLIAAGERNLWSARWSNRDVGWSWAMASTVLFAVILVLIIPVGGTAAGLTWLVRSAQEKTRQIEKLEAQKKLDDAQKVADQKLADTVDTYQKSYADLAKKVEIADFAGARSAITAGKAVLFDKTVQAQESQAQLKALQVGAEPTEATRSTITQLPTVTHRQPVYIQFAGSFTREQITDLNARLRDAGWNVQSKSGERVGAARRLNEVRFAGQNGAAADDLAKAISMSGIDIGASVEPKPFPIIGERNLELWISN